MARIDMHTHLLARGPEPLLDELATAERLARSYGIARMVLLGNLTSVGGPDPTPQDIMTINTHTLKVMALYPDLYIGFCYLNPAHPQIISSKRRWNVASPKAACAVSSCGLPSRPQMIVLIVSWIGPNVMASRFFIMPGINRPSTRIRSPRLRKLLSSQEMAARVTVGMAHLCGGSIRGVLDVADLPNVLIDTSGSQPEAGLWSTLCAAWEQTESSTGLTGLCAISVPRLAECWELT
jgi:hypothetical protein